MVSEAQDPLSGRREGLLESLKVLAATLLAIAYTRLELFSHRARRAVGVA